MKKFGKRFSAIVMACVMCATFVLCLVGCESVFSDGSSSNYTATSQFFWSSDAGATYGNGTKEYAVGENVYMKLILKVDSEKDKQEEIKVTLTIPYVQDVVSKYMDGTPITPEIDEINQTATYNFNIIASKNANETELVFKFVPVKAADATITLTFDDKVSSTYDKQNTITFVEPSGEVSE